MGTEFVYYLKGCDFIQQCMNAKEYSKVCELPVETIRRLCRTNVLRYVQRGKVYLVNIACGDVYFEADWMYLQEKYSGAQLLKRQICAK